ncbi:MAG: hypothetical protein DMF62_04535 [Acidobacteria bacterium]|nr:MAG: hypothetical protein DMF62_04535 [Acidobacteriota bacterium]
MTTFFRQFWMHLAVIIVAVTALVLVSQEASANRVVLSEGYEDADLELQGKKLKGFALGSDGLIADWYWIRSLQYIGDKLVKNDLSNINIENLRPLNPRLLYPLLDNATDLDPRFIAAYTYGAVLLPAIDRDQAIALTEKGIQANPGSWRLYHYLGYIYWRANEFQKAADIYDEGSKIAGSPPFLKQMSAAMRTRGGSRDTARQIYTQMLNESDDRQGRQNAELRLMQLDSLDELDAINAVLKTVIADGSPCPSSLAPILPRLMNSKLPGGRDFRVSADRQLVDPTGIPYFLDRNTCAATVDGINSKIPKF